VPPYRTGMSGFWINVQAKIEDCVEILSIRPHS
jgi:hypothetical protein